MKRFKKRYAVLVLVGAVLAMASCGDKDPGVGVSNKGRGTTSQKEHTLEQRARQGDASAQLELGNHFLSTAGGGQVDKAIEWFRKSAAQGNRESMNQLGYVYQYGVGVPVDVDEALSWYRKSADLGFVLAEFNMGIVLQGQEKYREAATWYRKAADQGDAPAQHNLGVMYNHGMGVGKDLYKACELYRKSAEQDYAEGQCNYAAMFFNGWGGVDQNYVKARYLYQMAAEKGIPAAQHSIAVMYSNGLGGAVDHHKAVEWYVKAIQQGFEASMVNLAEVYKLIWTENGLTPYEGY